MYFCTFNMWKVHIVLLCCYLCLVYSENIRTKPSNFSSATITDVTNGANSFSFRLYKILSESSPNSNVLVSPLSLELLLALMYAGAGGATATEIGEALQLPNNGVDNILQGYNHLLYVLKDPALQIMTKLFIEDQFDIQDDFRNNAVNYFESAVENVNFRTDKNVINVINDWIEQKTNGKITDLVTSDNINVNTVMVLINVIHFKANWQMTFSESETYKGDFYITENEINKIDMMGIYDEKFRYLHHSGLNAKIIELPYKDNKFNMYIMLPDEIRGLTTLEKKLHEIDINSELTKLKLQLVDVTIPKFKLTQTIDFKDILKSMGVNTMFSESEADFSGISSGPLVVSNIMQNAFIEVNENGTEAAGGTGSVISLRSFQIKTRFTADHPFLFLITKSGNNRMHKPLILFIGKFISK